MIPVVNLERGRKCVISFRTYLYLVSTGRRTRVSYPANSFQGDRINLVYVVDLRGSIVVLSVPNDVDQVVVGEVGDDVAEVRESPGDKQLFSILFQEFTNTLSYYVAILNGLYLEKMFLQGSGYAMVPNSETTILLDLTFFL